MKLQTWGPTWSSRRLPTRYPTTSSPSSATTPGSSSRSFSISAAKSTSAGSSASAARWRAWRSASRRAAPSRCSSANGAIVGRVTGRRLAEMSPETLTGEELQLDDAPARDAELFLVDGNNLAYRAFYALPEELATSDGMPTNALLGFGNMLFKLLADYKPHGVAVACDTRPVHRTAVAEAADVVYRQGRKPMPD